MNTFLLVCSDIRWSLSDFGLGFKSFGKNQYDCGGSERAPHRIESKRKWKLKLRKIVEKELQFFIRHKEA